jgi:hypothetical protein
METRTSLTMPSPDAAQRAIAGIDYFIIEQAVMESVATPAAQVIRSVWADSFARQGREFPDVVTETHGKLEIKHDPLKNGIALWELATGKSIYDKTIRRETVTSILDHINMDLTDHPYYGANQRNVIDLK